jgi:DNA-binding YbaB/EbfC family protein
MKFLELLEQAKALQQKVEKELDSVEVEASAGGGMVRVKMSGHKTVTSLSIDPKLFSEGDHAMLEDLVRAAVNDAAHQVDKALKKRMGSLGGGLLPGLG